MTDAQITRHLCTECARVGASYAIRLDYLPGSVGPFCKACATIWLKNYLESLTASPPRFTTPTESRGDAGRPT